MENQLTFPPSKVLAIDILTLQNDDKVIQMIVELTNKYQQVDLFIQNDQQVLKSVKDYETLIQSIYLKVFHHQKSILDQFDIIFESQNPTYLECKQASNISVLSVINVKPEIYKRAAIGGTFDYLHVGHKLLLSLALISTQQFLTIGITGNCMLINKKNKGVLQSYKTRECVVQNFARKFKPSVQIDIVELTEPAGPTKDGQYDGLIVTEETQGSVQYINDLRGSKNLEPINSYIIKLINQEDSRKISSSIIREQILQKNNIGLDDFIKIKEIWNQLIESVSPDSLMKSQVYFETTIINQYTQNQRYYHNLSHIFQLLQLYQELAETISDKKSILFTIFFHDLIYNPQSKLNEEESAQAFEQFSSLIGINLPFVKHTILQTKNHMKADFSQLTTNQLQDMKTFLDMDISILGKSPQEYIQYAQQIRNEYQHFDDQNFREGRSKVLITFLENEYLFYTEYFRERYEKQARGNIKQELIMLKG